MTKHSFPSLSLFPPLLWHSQLSVCNCRWLIYMPELKLHLSGSLLHLPTTFNSHAGSLSVPPRVLCIIKALSGNQIRQLRLPSQRNNDHTASICISFTLLITTYCSIPSYLPTCLCHHHPIIGRCELKLELVDDEEEWKVCDAERWCFCRRMTTRYQIHCIEKHFVSIGPCQGKN